MGIRDRIKADGHLKLTNIGGMQANNAEAENVRVITKFNGIYEGTCQLANPSVHVNGSYGTTPRTWDVMEVILDEDVKTKADAEAPVSYTHLDVYKRQPLSCHGPGTAIL